MDRQTDRQTDRRTDRQTEKIESLKQARSKSDPVNNKCCSFSAFVSQAKPISSSRSIDLSVIVSMSAIAVCSAVFVLHQNKQTQTDRQTDRQRHNALMTMGDDADKKHNHVQLQ